MIASIAVTVGAVATPTASAAGDAVNGGTGSNNGHAGAAPTTVPSGRAYVEITAGGDRTANGASIGALSAVRFAAKAQDGSGNPTGAEVAWCTTDTTGKCYLEITSLGAAYVVNQTSGPSGFTAVTSLRSATGGTAATSTARTYQFHTGTLASTNRVTLPRAESGSNSTATTTSGSWINRRDNAPLAPNCALKIGLLLDLSASVSQASGSQTAITNALTTFRNTLQGTATQIALRTFGTSSPAPGAGNAGWGLTPANLITNAQINGVSVANAQNPAQYTNWDAGLWSFAGTASSYNVIFVLTDGYPTRYGATGTPQGSGTNTRFIEMENAIASANYLKSQNVHIVAVGIGDGASGPATNLQAISGDTPNSDYIQLTGGFGTLETYLHNIANAACAGTISVQKNIVSVDGATTTPAGAGWQFTATAASPIVKVDGTADPYASSAAGVTGGGGNLTYRVDFSGTGSKVITIQETQQSGFLLKPYPDGKFAQCGTGATPTDGPLTVTNVGSAGATAGQQVGFSVTAALESTIKCQVQNQAQDQTARLRVDKHWNVYRDDGTGSPTLVSSNDGPSPTGFPQVTATLHLTGASLPQDATFGQEYGQLALGSTVTFSETVDLQNLPPLCTLRSATSPANGQVVLSIPSTSGVNTASITNTLTCQTKLTLAKSVVGGSADPDNWLLTARPGGTDGGFVGGAWQWLPAGDALTGPSGATGTAAATTNVSPSIVYPLAEAANPGVAGSAAVVAQYVQDFSPTQQEQWGPRHAGGATGSWVCIAATSVTNGVPVFGGTQVDGRNGAAQVPLGQWYQCTATNRLKPTIQLVKQIDDNGTLSTVPVGDSRWTLTAGEWVNQQPITPYPGAQADVAGPAGFDATAVLPGTYTLSESGTQPGYTNGTSFDCTVTGGEPLSATSQITLAAGQAAVCTIVNTVVQPTLTLKKQVVDLDGTASYSSAWTLTASNAAESTEQPINGTPSVAEDGIGNTVRNGVTYVLSESGGPADYTAGLEWVCSGGTFTAPDEITLGPGDNGTCTITNSQDFLPLVVSKTVTATYDRTYEWSIAKDVDVTTITTRPGGDATFNYTVTATPGGSTDGNWRMTGTITVTNANNVDVPVTVTDVTGVGGGASCAVVGGVDANVPANGSVVLDYACTFTSQPDYTGGTNTATVTWERNGGDVATGSAPVTFNLGTETNKTVRVVDDKTIPGESFDLGTATWNGAATPIPFSYAWTQRGVPGECADHTNTATISETGQSAVKTVEVCVTEPVDLKITKSDGDARPAPGDEFDYTLTVENVGGTDAAEDATVTDVLPDEFSWVTKTGDTVAGCLTLSVVGQRLTCVIDANLLGLADPPVVITVRAKVKPDTSASDVGYTNVSWVDSPEDPVCDPQTEDCIVCPAGQDEVNNNVDCEDTPVDTFDVGITKTHSAIDGDTLDPGESFDYILTVTNHGTATATHVVVTDDVPARLHVNSVVAPAGWSTQQTGNSLKINVASLAPGASAVIKINVTLISNPAVSPPATPLLPTDPAPSLPDIVVNSLTNKACVAADRDFDGSNNCGTTTVTVDDIAAIVYTRCVNDAAFLGYAVRTSASLTGKPITLLWTPDNGSASTVPPKVQLTLKSGDAAEISWPGVGFTPSGISIDYPGWRPLRASDYDANGNVIHPPQRLFNGLVLDNTEPDYVWREGTTIKFSVNPELTFKASYPPVTPACVVKRSADLIIEKSASVASVTAGNTFSYTLEVKNASPIGAASPVVVTDVIPADIRVDSIVTSTATFPNWNNSCVVTGKAANGFGGTLRCDLLGPLMMGASAPLITLNVTVDAATTATTVTNTGVVSWGLFDDPSVTGFDDDSVTVEITQSGQLPPPPPPPAVLPPTGSNSTKVGVQLAAIAIVLGGFALLVTRRRRTEG